MCHLRFWRSEPEYLDPVQLMRDADRYFAQALESEQRTILAVKGGSGEAAALSPYTTLAIAVVVTVAESESVIAEEVTDKGKAIVPPLDWAVRFELFAFWLHVIVRVVFAATTPEVRARVQDSLGFRLVDYAVHPSVGVESLDVELPKRQLTAQHIAFLSFVNEAEEDYAGAVQAEQDALSGEYIDMVRNRSRSPEHALTQVPLFLRFTDRLNSHFVESFGTELIAGSPADFFIYLHRRARLFPYIKAAIDTASADEESRGQ